jgi:hypothetical protein
MGGLTGVLLAAAATVPLALAGAGTSIWWLCPALVKRGIGLGADMVPVAVSYQGLDGPDG